jgi:DNA polymerase III delta prime subunit
MFSFYAAASSSSSLGTNAGATDGGKKHTLSGALKTASFLGRRQDFSDPSHNKACWLRITRRPTSHVAAPDHRTVPAVHRYLDQWMATTHEPSIEKLLLDGIDQAPKVPPTFSKREARQIESFVDEYRRYLHQKVAQQELEPIYNRLFEYHQHSHLASDVELVFGLGHARARLEGSRQAGEDDPLGGVLVNGPVLEVMVEVELAKDGALLVRPREHTGVSLNREVMGALAAGSTSTSTLQQPSPQLLTQLHQTVAELEPSHLSPGQPATYVPILRRIAVELSPGGTFVPSAAAGKRHDVSSKLVVTEAWCLYSRPKPTSVFARDASAFAEQLLQSRERRDQMTATPSRVPTAVWSLTHGPGELERVLAREANGARRTWMGGFNHWIRTFIARSDRTDREAAPTRALFPLPTSEAQLRIGHLLLTKRYPAVVVSGPPGTGKTHTIANMIAAFLCQGRRVLVTSKNASALSVVRGRLPRAVHELCVDVSTSELTGMRQLQRTVERLADRISVAGSDAEGAKCQLLQVRCEWNHFPLGSRCGQSLILFSFPTDQSKILELEEQLQVIDDRLKKQSDRVRCLLKSDDGERLIDLALQLSKSSPWLMKATATSNRSKLVELSKRVSSLVTQDSEPERTVTGFTIPPCRALIAACESNAGSLVAGVSNSTMHALGSVPVFGRLLGLNERCSQLAHDLSMMRIDGKEPKSQSDWFLVAGALKDALSAHSFQHYTWEPVCRELAWPAFNFQNKENVRILDDALRTAVDLNERSLTLDSTDVVRESSECRRLDQRRATICVQLQKLAEELVASTVMLKLSDSFSPDAQSALIRFAQIAGKARFAKASQPGKMSHRQRRKRQEYLEAFDRCCRFIPCWILTASQISDYLPPECLFDLVIIDEASQSDVTVLPGMLRGKQWLVVGDGKQVSPTESFISEEQIDGLRAALPSSPLRDSFLPGHSFFDLCQQAFPQGRVSRL